MPMTKLATAGETDRTAVSEDEQDLIRRTVAVGATESELKLYLFDCRRQGVHPLDKLLHFTKRGGRYVPITSIDLMRSRAAETGEYAGNSDAAITYASGDTQVSAATVTVTRLVHGERCDFTATARMSEYRPDRSQMWDKMPHTMLAKCAEACALRKGFPQQLAGLYGKEEMDQAIEERDLVPRRDQAIDERDQEEAPPHPVEAADAGFKPVTSGQVKRIYGKIKGAGKEKADVLEYVQATFNVESYDELMWHKSQPNPYDTVCAWIDSK
jgi:phage recombination protein Bet